MDILTMIKKIISVFVFLLVSSTLMAEPGLQLSSADPDYATGKY